MIQQKHEAFKEIHNEGIYVITSEDGLKEISKPPSQALRLLPSSAHTKEATSSKFQSQIQSHLDHKLVITSIPAHNKNISKKMAKTCYKIPKWAFISICLLLAVVAICGSAIIIVFLLSKQTAEVDGETSGKMKAIEVENFWEKVAQEIKF